MAGQRPFADLPPSDASPNPSEVPSVKPSAAETAATTTPEVTVAPVTDEAVKAAQRGPPVNSSDILHGRQLFVTCAAMMLAIFTVALDQTILSTALPKLASDFNAFQQQGLAAALFPLTQTGSILFFGQLLRIHKAKWIHLFGLLIFEVGSIICAAAPSMDVLLFGRAVAGVGGSALFASLLAIFAQITELHVRPKLFGIFGAVFGISTIIGPLLGGAIVDHSTWRWCFWLNVPIGGISAVVTFLLLPAALPVGWPGGDRSVRALVHATLRVDIIGTILFFGATACLSLGLSFGGNTHPWDSATVIVLLVVAVVTYIAWGLWNWRGAEKALVPTQIFKSYSIYAILALSFCVRYVMLGTMYYLPLFYQAVRRDSAIDSGLNLLAFMLGCVITIIAVGQIVGRIGYYWPFLVVGPALQCIGVGLLYLVDADISNGALIGFQIIAGLGVGMTMQNGGLAMQAEFKDTPKLVAQSSGLGMCMQFLGGTLGLSVSQAVFASELSSNFATYAPSAPAHEIANNPLLLYNVAASDLAGAVHAYTKSLDMVFILLVPFAGLSLISALFIKNIKISKPKVPKPADDVEAAKSEGELSKAGSHADEKVAASA